MILDAHVWLWLINGDITLSKSTRSLIDEHAETGGLYVSPISIWEIGMLNQKKRIILSKPLSDWVNKALELPGIGLSPITSQIAAESTQLPGDFHGDAADRMLVATARVEDFIMLTRDKNILRYSKDNYLQTIKA